MKVAERDISVFSAFGAYASAEFVTAFATNFIAWVMHGTAPPKSPRIEMANGEIVPGGRQSPQGARGRKSANLKFRAAETRLA
jgi:hypothetical protein